jgi:hypothetical protein
VSLAARHPDIWGDRRGDTSLLPPFLEPRSTGFGRDRLFHLQEIFRMSKNDCISTAIDIVSAWNIQDEDLAEAINDQARLMACVNPDELWEDKPDIH